MESPAAVLACRVFPQSHAHQPSLRVQHVRYMYVMFESKTNLKLKTAKKLWKCEKTARVCMNVARVCDADARQARCGSLCSESGRHDAIRRERDD